MRQCDFISFAMLPDEIDLTNGTESVVILPENFRIEANSVTAAKSAVCKGLGIQRLPAYVVSEELKNGTLVQVLPDWKPPKLGLFVLWPGGGPEKKLTRMLIDYISAPDN